MYNSNVHLSLKVGGASPLLEERSAVVMWLQLALYTIVAAYPDQPQLTFEDFYYSGKLAYTSKDWQQCISYMRRTIEDFR